MVISKLPLYEFLPYIGVLIVLIGLCLYRPQFRYKIIFAFSVLIWPRLFKLTYVELGLFMLCSFLFAGSLHHIRKNLAIRTRWLLTALITCFTLFYIQYSHNLKAENLIIDTVVFWLFCFFPFIIFEIWSISKNNELKIENILSALYPGWVITFFHPIGNASLYQLGASAQNHNEHYTVFRSGIKLLMWSLILFFIESLIKYLDLPIYEKFFLKPGTAVRELLLKLSSSNSVSSAEAWTVYGMDFFSFFLGHLTWGLVFVGIFRCFGINIKKNTFGLHNAKSWLEFVSGFNYYFKELLLWVGFWPMFFLLNKFSIRVRFICGVLYSVICMNWIFHYVYHFRWYWQHDRPDLFNFSSTYWSYALFLAISILVSAGFTYDERWQKLKINLPLLIRIPLYFFIFSLLRVLEWDTGYGLKPHLNLLRALLGIQAVI